MMGAEISKFWSIEVKIDFKEMYLMYCDKMMGIVDIKTGIIKRVNDNFKIIDIFFGNTRKRYTAKRIKLILSDELERLGRLRERARGWYDEENLRSKILNPIKMLSFYREPKPYSEVVVLYHGVPVFSLSNKSAIIHIFYIDNPNDLKMLISKDIKLDRIKLMYDRREVIKHKMYVAEHPSVFVI